MSRLSSWACPVVLLLLLAQSESRAAVPAAETLLPNTTKAFLAVPSIATVRDHWNATELGQLMQDPTMKPFIEDLRRQMQEKWTKTHERLGIHWEDLEGVPSGEVAVAVVLPTPTETVLTVLADVTGREKETSELLQKLHQNLTGRKGVRRERQALGTKIIVYDIPKHDEEPARQVAYFVKDDLLAAADSAKFLETLAARAGGGKQDSLARLAAFDAITKRVKKTSGDLVPDVRWFVEPFGYADAMRLESTQPRKKGTDMLKILREQGFTAIEGIGGFVNFAAEGYEILHRSFVYAPGNPAGVARFTLAARMLEFPNSASGETFTPPAWVPRDVASYAAFNVDTKNAFENSKTLVNAIVGDEVFEDVLDSIKTDENGPQIDVRREIIAHLGNRVTIISDLQLPITPKSERMLFAIGVDDETQMADVVRRWMESDPDTKRREINGHTVWEVVDEEAELPMVTIENSPTFAGAGGKDEGEEEPEEKPLLPNSAVTVAHGHLLIATHIDILNKVLARVEEREQLAKSADYQRVQEDLAKLAMPQQFGQMFTRTDEAYRGTYELFRTGKLPEAESMVGKMLNSLLGDGKEGVLRTQRLDGSKLPEYDVVRRYLGPAGVSTTTEADGWFITGFLLKKDGQ